MPNMGGEPAKKKEHVVSQAVKSINTDWGLSSTHGVTTRNTNILPKPVVRS